ncbi:MAG TPA: carboxypeptidase regulatory-like domain-containing protein [Deltaproteobacteria bacterium]|nr:carboxypeptidase regulatory-like domain-containing protein [Deltaproteobacteria bacterium]
MRLSLMIMWVVGCSGGGPTDDKNTADTGPGPLDSTDTGGFPSTTFDRSAQLSGSVLDDAGAPINKAQIRFCRGEACRNDSSDETGAFDFDEVHVDWHSLEVIPPLTSTGLATAFAPVVFATDESRTIDVVLPTLDPPTDLPPTPEEIEAGEGLFITVGIDDLEEPLFLDPPSDIAGILVDPAQQVPVDLAGTVIAMWYLAPFDYRAAAGMPVRFANSWGLPEGKTYKVMLGSYEDQRWLDAGSVTVSGAWLEGDASLSLTSTVVLLEE